MMETDRILIITIIINHSDDKYNDDDRNLKRMGEERQEEAPVIATLNNLSLLSSTLVMTSICVQIKLRLCCHQVDDINTDVQKIYTLLNCSVCNAFLDNDVRCKLALQLGPNFPRGNNWVLLGLFKFSPTLVGSAIFNDDND